MMYNEKYIVSSTASLPLGSAGDFMSPKRKFRGTLDKKFRDPKIGKIKRMCVWKGKMKQQICHWAPRSWAPNGNVGTQDRKFRDPKIGKMKIMYICGKERLQECR